MAKGMCGRCYAEDVEIFPAKCIEKPELLAGKPIGQYHCPDCGAMILAGMPHPDLCKTCLVSISVAKSMTKREYWHLLYD